jgi:hypothetical protein
MHPTQNHGHDGPPSLPPHHAGWIDVADVRARYPLAVSGALCGLGGERVEVPSMQRTILGVGSEWPLQFSPMVKIVRCQTSHLTLLIFIELG